MIILDILINSPYLKRNYKLIILFSIQDLVITTSTPCHQSL